MKKVILFLLISLCCLGIQAEDIKVGDAKYKLYPNGTAELKDYKKASGQVVIPETVKDPKTGKEYPVTSIGQNAFKSSSVTAVEIPSSVSSIGKGAFKECLLLASVELPTSVTDIPAECFYGCTNLKELKCDLVYIENVGPKAFYLTGLGSVEPGIRYYMGNNTVRNMYAIYPDGESAPANVPLVIPAGVNMKDVNVLQFTGTPPVLIFQDKEAGKQAMDVMKKLIEVMVPQVPNVYNAWYNIDSYFSGDRNDAKSLGEYMRLTSYKGMEPRCYIYYGLETTDEGLKVTQEEPYGAYEAIEAANENWGKEKFIAKLEDFVEAAINEPIRLERCYANITPEEAVKYNSYMRRTVYILGDSIYIPKPELTPVEMRNLKGFINNTLMCIGADYGIANMTLNSWAKADLLNHDTDNPQRKEDYEQLLKMNERVLKSPDPGEISYSQALQLAALCGLGRWKEAAAYFPKVHRSVTANGTYGVPYELTYMQQEIQKRGYKATAPSYKKSKKVSSSSNKTDLVDFFVSEAIEAGVRHYEKKRAEKKAREMFYESVGLDKKGRPKK